MEISGCVLVSERNGLEPAAKGQIIFRVNARQHTLNQLQVILGIFQLPTVKRKTLYRQFLDHECSGKDQLVNYIYSSSILEVKGTTFNVTKKKVRTTTKTATMTPGTIKLHCIPRQ